MSAHVLISGTLFRSPEERTGKTRSWPSHALQPAATTRSARMTHPWYRRRAKAREQAAQAAREAVLDRLAWQIAELRVNLDKCAFAHAAMAAELN